MEDRPFGYHDALANAVHGGSSSTSPGGGESDIGDDTSATGAQSALGDEADLFADVPLSQEPVYPDVNIGRNLRRIRPLGSSSGANDAALDKLGTDPFDGHDALLYCHMPALLRYSLEGGGGGAADFSGGSQASGDTVGGGNLGAIAYAASAAVLLGLHHANTGNGVVAPAVEGLHERCPIRFTTEVLDAGGSGLDAVTALTGMVTRRTENADPRPCAVIGAHVSSAASKLASLGAVFDLPVVSSSAMSTELNDPKQYPTLARTHTDVGGFGEMAVSYLKNNLGVAKVGMLFGNDAYGLGFANSVLKASADMGVEVVGGGVAYLPGEVGTGGRRRRKQRRRNQEDSEGPYEDEDSDNESDIRMALQTLAKTGCNYFVGSFYAESLATIFELAAEYGLAGPGKFWLISGTADIAPYMLGGALQLPKDSAVAKAIEGNGVYFCEGGVPGLGGSYDTFSKKWREMGEDPQALAYVNSKQPAKRNGEGTYAFPPEFFAKRPHHVVTFSYDAAIGLALSACDAWEQKNNRTDGTRRFMRGSLPQRLERENSANGMFSGSEHHSVLARASFQAASGTVEFRESFPTRTAESSYFVMANLRAVDANSTHVKFMGSPVVNYFNTTASKWENLGNNSFIYPGGVATAPREMIPSSGRMDTGAIVGITLAAVLFPMAIIVLLLHRQSKRRRDEADAVWKVKASELTFDDPPVVIGRGSFGLVLIADYRGTRCAVKRVIPPRSGSEVVGGRRTSDETTSSFDKKIGAVAPRRFSQEGLLDNPRKRRSSTNSLDVYFEESFLDEDIEDDFMENGNKSDNSGLVSGGLSSSNDGISSAKHRNHTSPLGMQSSVKSLVKRGGDSYSRLKADFIDEMRHISKLRHPSICTVMGAVIESGHEPMLIMEYMEMGSLFSLLHNETVPLSGEILLPILKDVAKGMRFLHSAIPELIHGDLKSANVLVDSKLRGKVTDFGLSLKKQTGAVGTPYWMAPELLRQETSNSAASDVYAFGIILYESYSRQTPYEGEDYKEVIRLVADPKVAKRPPVPPSCPPQIESMMEDCVTNDANARPTFEELDKRLERMEADNINPADFSHSMQIRKDKYDIYENFPKWAADALRMGRKVEPQAREMVTIFFSDIVGFTDISSKLSPLKISDMLDRLYNLFDDLSHKYDIFKVETIGDAYMAVTNLVKDQPDHAKRAANFAIEALTAAAETLIDTDDPSLGFVNIRVGLHSGPVVANVVGSRNLKFSIFGDAVNVAARMESNSETNRIQCSDHTGKLLRKQDPLMPLRKRGAIEIKGKGKMMTYWVNEMGRNRRGSDSSSCSSTSTTSTAHCDEGKEALPVTIERHLPDLPAVTEDESSFGILS